MNDASTTSSPLAPQAGQQAEHQPPKGVSCFPDYIAFGVYFGALLGAGAVNMASGKGFTPFLDAGLFLTAILFGFTTFRHGILHELRWFIKLGSAVALGLFFRDQIAKLLGLSGLLGMLVGFYLTFLVTYILVGWLLNRVAPEGPPTLPGRWLGFVFGFLEGGLFFSLVVYLIPFAAPNSALDNNRESLGAQIAEACMAPVSKRIASTPLVLLEVARDARGGIDPQKMDRESLTRQFEPLRNNPKIRALGEDAEFSRLLTAKDFKGLLQHPKVVALYSDPELEKLGNAIDWPAVAKAIRQGIQPPGGQVRKGPR
ncbi:MAG: CvpA family protein [Candidatus Ozemobacteraceae bacterium]